MTTNNDQQQLSPEEDPGSPQDSHPNDATSSNSLDHVQLLSHLIHLSLALQGKTQGVVEPLCQEITDAAREQMQLILLQQNKVQLTLPNLPQSVLVEAQGRLYGQLFFTSIVPFSVAHMLADVC